jgi:hypothetical protein
VYVAFWLGIWNPGKYSKQITQGAFEAGLPNHAKQPADQSVCF